MAETLGWDNQRKQKELEDAQYFLHIMNSGRTGKHKKKKEIGYNYI